MTRFPSSARHSLRLTVRAEQAGTRLIDLLGAELPARVGHALTRSAVRRLVMAGVVRVDGRVCWRPGRPMAGGTRIDADLARLPRPEPVGQIVLGAADVLYEDEYLLAVNKPAGLAMHPTADPRRPNLVDCLKLWLAQRGRPTRRDVYLGLHQRLDRDTSGVALFTLDPAANARLKQQFEERVVVKIYHALTARPRRLPPRAWRCSLPLEIGGNGRVALCRGEAGVDAQTDFTLLEVFPNALLVEARPRTGRKHQVRVHLAHAGLPVLGDRLYGSGQVDRAAARTMLHAARLELRHPLTGAPLLLVAHDPADFQAALRARSQVMAGHG